MKRLLRLRPTPAMIVACIALAVALGGTSYAAVTLPRNSVGTKQIKNKAVTGVKVRNHTLAAIKMKSGVLPDMSDYYTQSEALSRFLRGTVTRVASNSVSAGASGDVKVTCPSGYEAIGGGVDSHQANVLYVTSSSPIYANDVRLADVTDGDHVAAVGWFVSAFNTGPVAVSPLKVAVICSPIGGTAAP
ncbi:MAG: hypothetical protein WBQ14_01510 [Gaiellaceae bacterium]